MPSAEGAIVSRYLSPAAGYQFCRITVLYSAKMQAILPYVVDEPP